MPTILSICETDNAVWVAGPDGLFLLDADGERAITQPQSVLVCFARIGNTILTGGAPYGVALSTDNGVSWQAAWMDNVAAPVICLAADPQDDECGLAGTEGGGILRTANSGQRWTTCNVGLQSYT